jgi:hypothetical protein
MNANRNGNHRLQRPRPGADRRGNGRIRQHGPGQGARHGNSSANAQKNYERYLALAREAALSGDTVEMENCYQHAEHYFRVMRERTV